MIHQVAISLLTSRELPGRRVRWLTGPQALPAEFLSVCETTIEPGEGIHPAHAHTEEVVVVLQGEVEFLVQKEALRASAGAAVLIPAHAPHMVRNVGSEPVRLLCACAPSTQPSAYTTHPELRWQVRTEAEGESQ